MKKTFRRLIAVLLSICVVLSVGLTENVTVLAGQAKTGKTLPTTQAEVWKRTDIILTSDKEYTNPYLDVEIDAVFEHTDGTKIHLYGFWNGEMSGACVFHLLRQEPGAIPLPVRTQPIQGCIMYPAR